jgi:hypothetical protein
LPMLFLRLISRTVGGRGVLPESRLRDLRIYLDWRKPIHPSRVFPI